MEIQVKIPEQSIKDLIDLLSPQKQALAMKRAVNRTGNRLRTILKREISSQYNIKNNQVRIQFFPATTDNNLIARLTARRAYLSLYRFNARQNSQGVTVSVIRGANVLIPNALIVQPKGKDYKSRGQKNPVTSNVPIVVVKTGGKKPYPLQMNKAIESQYSLSIGNVIAGKQMQDRINKFIQQYGIPYLESEITYQMTGKRKFADIGE